MSQPTQVLYVRVDADVLLAIKSFAEDDERTLTAYVSRMLRAHVVERLGERELEQRRRR